MLPYGAATFHGLNGANWIITLMSDAIASQVSFHQELPDFGAAILPMGLGLPRLAGVKKKFRS